MNETIEECWLCKSSSWRAYINTFIPGLFINARNCDKFSVTGGARGIKLIAFETSTPKSNFLGLLIKHLAVNIFLNKGDMFLKHAMEIKYESHKNTV